MSCNGHRRREVTFNRLDLSSQEGQTSGREVLEVNKCHAIYVCHQNKLNQYMRHYLGSYNYFALSDVHRLDENMKSIATDVICFK